MVVLSSFIYVQYFPKSFLKRALFYWTPERMLVILEESSKYLQAAETEPVQEPHQEGRGESLSEEW